jgi:hypothetical protein
MGDQAGSHCFGVIREITKKLKKRKKERKEKKYKK